MDITELSKIITVLRVGYQHGIINAALDIISNATHKYSSTVNIGNALSVGC